MESIYHFSPLYQIKVRLHFLGTKNIAKHTYLFISCEFLEQKNLFCQLFGVKGDTFEETDLNRNSTCQPTVGLQIRTIIMTLCIAVFEARA